MGFPDIEDRSIWDKAAEYISLDRNSYNVKIVEQWIIESDVVSMKKYLSSRMVSLLDLTPSRLVQRDFELKWDQDIPE